MTKSEKIKSDLTKYKCAIRLNNFSDSEAIEKEYSLYGSPPYMVIEDLNELLANAELSKLEQEYIDNDTNTDRGIPS